MKLFIYEPKFKYSGGCIVILANNKNEADLLFHSREISEECSYKRTIVLDAIKDPKIIIEKIYIE
jgi:hypothetical protein